MIRSAADRGKTNLGWLDSRHSFSFGQYQHPEHNGFGPLRVINDDRVDPKLGFAEHPHRDMEIISYVVEGELAHKDSTGTESVVSAGGVQRMSAGSGVRHSEFNPSRENPVRFLQIWIEPASTGIEPSYEEVRVDAKQRPGELVLFASKAGRDGSAVVHQDAELYAAVLRPGDRIEHAIAPERRVWVQVVRGSLSVADEAVSEGDGVAVIDESALELVAGDGESEVLLFDLV